MENTGDSFDLIPIAGWYGTGKRGGMIGAYLLACRNGEKFETVTRIGTGFSDEQLNKYTEHFEKIKAEGKPLDVKVTEQYYSTLKPDFWIKPEDSCVWEIKVANLSLSD